MNYIRERDEDPMGLWRLITLLGSLAAVSYVLWLGLWQVGREAFPYILKLVALLKTI